jgi:hypothetical protein
MSFDPKDVAGRPSTHKGTYPFTVARATKRVFSTGTEGFELEMDVFIDNDRVIKCYENLFYTRKAKWKVRDLCDSVGIDFEARPEPEEYVGKSGKAFFSRKGDRRWLEVEEFFPRGGLEVVNRRKTGPVQAETPADDVPPEPPEEDHDVDHGDAEREPPPGDWPF